MSCQPIFAVKVDTVLRAQKVGMGPIMMHCSKVPEVAHISSAFVEPSYLSTTRHELELTGSSRLLKG